MTPQTTAYLVGAICAVTSLGFWIWLVAVPVARSFEGARDRSVAAFLSFYTLLVGLGIGTGIGLVVFYNWDRIAGVN